jgi:hypothetical protein
MKKKNLKLGLKKVNVSNLSSIRGGIQTVSCTCPVIDTTGHTDACPNTQETTCWSGLPKCGNYTDDCHASHASHCPFTTHDVCD